MPVVIITFRLHVHHLSDLCNTTYSRNDLQKDCPDSFAYHIAQKLKRDQSNAYRSTIYCDALVGNTSQGGWIFSSELIIQVELFWINLTNRNRGFRMRVSHQHEALDYYNLKTLIVSSMMIPRCIGHCRVPSWTSIFFITFIDRRFSTSLKL